MKFLTDTQRATALDYAKFGSPKNMFDLMNAMMPRTSVVSAAFVMTADDMCGQTYFLSLAAGFAITLPAPQLGMRCKFIVATAPTGGDYAIGTNGGANIGVVSVNELETDTTEDGPSDDDADAIALKANLAAKGDYLDVYCDGSFWHVIGQTRLDGAVTTATT